VNAGSSASSNREIWCNGFFHQVTESLLQHGGVPVKYMGDGMLAFFAGGDHSRRAIAASVSARDVVADPLVIGLAAPVQLATIGHASYARPDVLGPTVNRAFRVNEWTMAHARSRIGAAVPEAGEAAEGFRFGDPVGATLKGIPDPVRLREVVGYSSETE
jgi:class 3 adenylate cyclase